MKNIQTEITSQVPQTKTAETTAFLEIKERYDSQPSSDAHTWITIAKLCYKYEDKIVYTSQTTLGLWRGLHRSTICHQVSRMENDGHLIVENHPYTTNSYFLPEHFYTQLYKKSFFRFLSSLALFSINLLISKPALDQNRTVLIKDNDSYIYGSLIVSNVQATQNRLKRREKKRMTKLERCKQLAEIAKVIPLTDHGICKLAAYNSAVIDWVTKRWGLALKSQDPWAYLMGLATDMSQKNNYPIQWDIYFDLKRSFCVEDNNEVYLDPVALSEAQADFQESQQREGREFSKQEPTPFLKKQEIPFVHRLNPPVPADPRQTADERKKEIEHEMKRALANIIAEPQDEFQKIMNGIQETHIKQLIKELARLTGQE